MQGNIQLDLMKKDLGVGDMHSEFEMVGIADLFRGLDLPLQMKCPPHPQRDQSGNKPEGVSEGESK